MAQATGLLAFSSMGDAHKSKLYMLVGIDKARFRGQVVPGDQLVLKISLKRNMRGIGMYQCEARINGDVVAEAEMMCSAQDRNQ
jgi:3-hydroxyacyl-[acyl-carrier-protein] dehydratase